MRLGVSALTLEHVRQIVQHGISHPRLRGGLLQRRRRLAPFPLPRQRQARVEARRAVGRLELEDALELAHRFVEHPGLVEGDAEIPMLLDARLGHPRLGRGLRASDAVDETSRDQPVDRLADLELDQPRLVDDRLHVPMPVDEIDHGALLVGELGVARFDVRAVDLEHDVEARDLLLDEVPLVHASRALEQQRLGIDRDEQILFLGMNVGLEVERSLHPGEQEIHRLLDLAAHVLVQLLARQGALLHEQLADALVPMLHLRRDGGVELILRDDAVLHEHVAEPVAPVDDGRVRDAPLLEEDVAEVALMRDRQAARFLPHREELENVGKRGFL